MASGVTLYIPFDIHAYNVNGVQLKFGHRGAAHKADTNLIAFHSVRPTHAGGSGPQ